jgi:hypothetical protein
MTSFVCFSFYILVNLPYTVSLMDCVMHFHIDAKFDVFQLRRKYLEEGKCFAKFRARPLVPVHVTYT